VDAAEYANVELVRIKTQVTPATDDTPAVECQIVSITPAVSTCQVTAIAHCCVPARQRIRELDEGGFLREVNAVRGRLIRREQELYYHKCCIALPASQTCPLRSM